MFNSQQKKYIWKKPTTSENSLHETIVTYDEVGEISAFIALQSAGNNFTKGSPQEVMTCQYVGSTSMRGVEAGDMIDQFKVKYVVPAANQFFFYCERIEDGKKL